MLFENLQFLVRLIIRRYGYSVGARVAHTESHKKKKKKTKRRRRRRRRKQKKKKKKKVKLIKNLTRVFNYEKNAGY
jgi:hypothetical protein